MATGWNIPQQQQQLPPIYPPLNNNDNSNANIGYTNYNMAFVSGPGISPQNNAYPVPPSEPPPQYINYNALSSAVPPSTPPPAHFNAAALSSAVPPSEPPPAHYVNYNALSSAVPPSVPPPLHINPASLSSAVPPPEPPPIRPMSPMEMSQDTSPQNLTSTLAGAVGLDWLLTSTKPNKEPVVPSGYELRFTSKGRPYFHKSDTMMTDEEDNYRETMSLFCSAQELENKFGIGIRMYFDFVKYLMAVNFLLALVSLISFIPHGVHIKEQWQANFVATIGVEQLDYLFISSYQPDDRPGWTAMVAIAVVVSFAVGPVYYFGVKFFPSSSKRKDDGDMMGGITGTNTDVIEQNKRIPSAQYNVRRFFAWLIFFVSLCIPIGITFLLSWYGTPDHINLQISNPSTLNRVKTGIALACAATVTATNTLWEFVCTFLTDMEKHRTYTAKRMSNTFRLVFFKILNVITLFVVRYLVERRKTACIASTLGLQFLIFVLLELTIMNMYEVLYPVIYRIVRKKALERSELGDDATRPEFDLAEEYLEIIYRQFYIYIGITIFPLIAVIGFFTYVVEFWVDKYRLLRICQKPKPTRENMRSLIVFFLGFIAVAAFVSYPTAPIYFSEQTGLSTVCFPCPQYSSNLNSHFTSLSVCPWSFLSPPITSAGDFRYSTNPDVWKASQNSRSCVCKPCTMYIFNAANNWDSNPDRAYCEK